MAVRVITLGLLIGLSLTAFANSLTGKVVKITDGDTRYVLDANYTQHKIRLAGIDAPERKQAYGLASRKYLARYIHGPRDNRFPRTNPVMASMAGWVLSCKVWLPSAYSTTSVPGWPRYLSSASR